MYLRDLDAGTTTLVTVNAAGTDSALWDHGTALAFSPDGTKIAFVGFGIDLLGDDRFDPGVPIAHPDSVYVRDLVHETTTLVSADASGTGIANDDSGIFSREPFSPDGRRIAYVSDASNLGPSDHDDPRDGDRQDVYVATLRGGDLSLTGSVHRDPVEPGGIVAFRFDVANAGPDTAEDVRLAVLLPEGVSFMETADTPGECTDPDPERPQLVVCQIWDVAVDDGIGFYVEARVEAPAGTTLAARATVGSQATVDPTYRNNTVVVEATVSGTP